MLSWFYPHPHNIQRHKKKNKHHKRKSHWLKMHSSETIIKAHKLFHWLRVPWKKQIQYKFTFFLMRLIIPILVSTCVLCNPSRGTPSLNVSRFSVPGSHRWRKNMATYALQQVNNKWYNTLLNFKQKQSTDISGLITINVGFDHPWLAWKGRPFYNYFWWRHHHTLTFKHCLWRTFDTR